MGFSNQEAINLNFAALAAGVIDANSSAVWFEKQFGFSFVLDANTVWTQLSSIPAAGNLTTARNNASAIGLRQVFPVQTKSTVKRAKS